MSLSSSFPSDSPRPPHSPHTVINILRLLNRSPNIDKQLHESHAHQQHRHKQKQQQQQAAAASMWRSGHNGRGRGHSRDGPKADGGGGGERKVPEGQRQEATQRSAAISQRAPAAAAAVPSAEPLSLPQRNVTLSAGQHRAQSCGSNASHRSCWLISAVLRFAVVPVGQRPARLRLSLRRQRSRPDPFKPRPSRSSAGRCQC